MMLYNYLYRMKKKLLRHKLLLSVVGFLVVALIVFGIYQIRLLHKAHSTFDNYYSFRGCVKLLKKTPTYVYVKQIQDAL